MSKRLFSLVSLLIIASMVLAACATATSAPGTTEPPAGSSTCADPIGCVTIAPDEPVHIAYAMVISGADATLGIDSRNGAEIAVSDKGGKVLNHDIKFDGEDDLCSAEGGQAAGTKLAADSYIVAVLGTSCSSAIRVAMPL